MQLSEYPTRLTSRLHQILVGVETSRHSRQTAEPLFSFHALRGGNCPTKTGSGPDISSSRWRGDVHTTVPFRPQVIQNPGFREPAGAVRLPHLKSPLSAHRPPLGLTDHFPALCRHLIGPGHVEPNISACSHRLQGLPGYSLLRLASRVLFLLTSSFSSFSSDHLCRFLHRFPGMRILSHGHQIVTVRGTKQTEHSCLSQ